MPLVGKVISIIFGGFIIFGILSIGLIFYNLAMDYNGLRSTDFAMVDSMPQSAPVSQSTPSVSVSEGFADTQTPSSPTPATDTYYQQYETIDYLISGRSQSLPVLCDILLSLRNGARADFRSFDKRENTCRAEFFTEESEVERIVALFEQYPEITIETRIDSVTTRYTTLTNDLTILKEQLAETERFIETSQALFNEAIELARENNDISALNATIDSSISRIDHLQQRQVNLANRIRNMERQHSELAKRIDKVRFSVQFSRILPLQTGVVERKWQEAWQDLKDTFTDTSIGLSTGLGVFLLWVVRIGIYIVLIIIILRLLYGFSRFVWTKW